MSATASFVEAPGVTRCGRVLAAVLNDPRDAVFVHLMIQIVAVQISAAIALFVLGTFSWWLAPVYWALWGGLFLDRFILMLHCTSHRPLFKPRVRFLNQIIPWVIGPFCGETPETYFAHHLGMHHKEGNLPVDLSSTMKYRRDNAWHWVRYFTRFFFCTWLELPLYLVRRKRGRLARRFLFGETAFWLAVGALGLWVSWQATIVVFVVPVLVTRFLMMAGNWGQHAFVDPHRPDNDHVNSLTCINTRYNRRCFNDGYHIVHHLKPAMHYTEMPAEFHANKERYGKEDAIVFDGVDFFGVWALLMTRRLDRLARHFVRLPGAPARTDAEVVALFHERLAPFDTKSFPAAR